MLRRQFLLLGGTLLATACAGPDGSSQDATPFERRWYEERDIELPLPFGVGVNVIGMERDIAVTDVTVTLENQSPESISDRVDFGVRNQTMLSMVRLDAWALPFLDVYLMLGQTRTETSLRSNFEIDRPGGGDPIPVELEQQSKVSGPLYGGGATLVGGYGDWFAMLDANYSRSDLETFDSALDAWFVSGRVGRQFTGHRTRTRVWGGVAYLDSRRTLSISANLPIVGLTRVDVAQEPVNPWTYELGGGVTLDRHWDFLLELGSNFEDAALIVASVSYRF